MGVVLYRPGETHEANGIKCELKIFDEYSFLPNLEAGWFMTPEECLEKPEHSEVEPVVRQGCDEVVNYETMPIKELRKLAEKVDSMRHTRTRRVKLIRIITDDNQD